MNLSQLKIKIVTLLAIGTVVLPLIGFAQATVPSSPTSSGGITGASTPPPGGITGGTTVPDTSSLNQTNTNVVTLKNPLQNVNSISDLILAFMKIVSYLAVIVGVLMLMWVGLQFVLARGNPEELKKRSNELLWIIIGIAVILGARILISVIINTLQATGTVNPAIIQSAQSVIKSQ